ncbi:hypothetical protein MTF65_24960 [Streptomyces sp. APSN-46.1]|uniref:hypothetical protein n=1 Tax=Streptomyces sp. APSN-46.1 TaxID=2929049 RepID=UPI001FB2F376|nr:hypothetical protein [Streptomyces sp. APSN-46.1]MCJ1680539.1 hypothetical protein [Streptomyces sp. APSN-46.1]
MTATVDIPAIRTDRLTPAQETGRSCCWCSYWASPDRPVAAPRTELRLRACQRCADLYGIETTGTSG